jgi:FAD/FMN-containing dehydrogenase
MELTSWGRYPRIKATSSSFETEKELPPLIEREKELIPRGMGRSYGDSAINTRVITTARYNKIHSFDSVNGVVVCESGVTLAELIEIYLSRGWFLSITPGTRLITLGGAIASDVHGKNHHTAGCFSECVLWFDLLLPDKSIVRCSREENRELFLATCGGMGLTGIIMTTAIKLKRVNSAFIRETVVRCNNLSEIFQRFEEYQSTTFSVAWIDCLASGKRIGRSVLMAGEHADTGRLNMALPRSLSVPFDFPGFCLNKYSVAIFNQLYFHKSPSLVKDRLVLLEPFFYPLDKIGNWNRIYGRKGFTQYQVVIPRQSAYDALKKILNRIAEEGLGSFLAVLKLLGPENENYISFPMDGYTLALDFKIQPKLFPFLDELDRIVMDFGGRIYLTKDVRMSKEVFRKGYPRWEKFAEIREKYDMKGTFESLQSKRLEV